MGLLDFLKPKTNANHLPTEPNVTVNIQITEPDKAPIIPLEERIKNVYPSANGLYPHEILMLYYANTYKTENNSFQRFWEYDYSVFEPQKVLDSLFKRGFICVADISVVLKKISVPELKELLKKAECKTSGKKDELIIRILDKYSKEELEKILPVKYYALTSLGENELQQNEYVVYLHKHHYMSAFDMNIALNKSNFDHKLYRDIIWGHFNQQIMEYYKNTDFGLYRNIRLDMYNFLVEENRYKDAFWHLTEVASYDLSGLGNGFANILSLTDKRLEFDCIMVNFFISDDKTEVTVPAGIIREFDKMFNELKMTVDEFKAFTHSQFSKTDVPYRVFSADECANIILSEIGLEERKLKNTYQIAEKRVKQIFNI